MCFIADGGVSSWEPDATCVIYKPLINNRVCVTGQQSVQGMMFVGNGLHCAPCAEQTNGFGMCASPCWHRSVWLSAGDPTPPRTRRRFTDESVWSSGVMSCLVLPCKMPACGQTLSKATYKKNRAETDKHTGVCLVSHNTSSNLNNRMI